MNIQEFIGLQAERNTLNRLLADIPGDNVLERSGLEARREEVDKQLSAAGTPKRGPAQVRLTFGGRPVVGQHGVFAQFGAQATNLFNEAVAKVAAALSGPLSSKGPIPKRDESQLLITSTAIGSFGFELEEHRPGLLDFGDDSSVGQALESTRRLLESTLGSDDDLADQAAGTDPRAIAAVREFLDCLAANEAVCTVTYRDQAARFADVGQVRRAVERLSRDNLREDEGTLHGEFQGVLPDGRRFEYRLSDSGEVIRGKIGPAIAEPDLINRHLHRPVTIKVLATQVGNGKPRYVLLEVPRWANGT